MKTMNENTPNVQLDPMGEAQALKYANVEANVCIIIITHNFIKTCYILRLVLTDRIIIIPKLYGVVLEHIS